MNPRVDFYLLPTTTHEETFRYACRLAEKSYLSQQQTFLWMTSKEDAERINDILWTFRDVGFVPHALFENNPKASEPVLIGFKKSPAAGDVLINLTPQIPDFFSHFKRVIELVSDQPVILAENRKKYRAYSKHNCELFSHDLKKQLA